MNNADFIINLRWFNSEDLHGTLMPRKSSMETAISDGVQVTLRSKSHSSAVKLKAVRQQYEDRVKFWNDIKAEAMQL